MSNEKLNANDTLTKVLDYVSSPFKLFALVVMAVLAFGGYFVYTNQDLLVGAYKESKKLPSIAEDRVEDAANNTTRFVVLAPQPLDPASLVGEDAMTTFIFEVNNVPAALYKALGCFATNGVNMTKLESYQKGASFAATMFFADIVGAPGDAGVDRAFAELAFHAKEMRLLGTYRSARKRG